MSQAVQKYSVNQHLIDQLLVWVSSGEIAIPEIQRPFVWKASQVRDLLDSLYKGYPVGYLITWKNPNIRLKDGSTSTGKKILIDGQQRVTALGAAILGLPVVGQDYRKRRIRIAFHPVEERFEVLNRAIERNPAWIPDIAEMFKADLLDFVEDYVTRSEVDRKAVSGSIQRLAGLGKRQIGLIDLDADLDIETVTEVFIRINSKGVVLSQADFAMSKIAASDAYGGPHLRKTIDYFCHLAKEPAVAAQVEVADAAFTRTETWKQIAWLRDETDDLYDPDYTDVLRVAFTSEFGRGKLSDLVALLSGRNFATREYEDDIARESFERLTQGVKAFTSEWSFKQFLMIVRSAGFVTSQMIRSRNALNSAYILFLRLRRLKVAAPDIERFVRRWLALSILTGRYSGASETALEADARLVDERFPERFALLEQGDLSDAFWTVTLPQALDSSSSGNPRFQIFLAAQVRDNDRGFLSREIRVKDLLTHRGDLHHLFPAAYLRGAGVVQTDRNQIANYAMMQAETNIALGAKAPADYFSKLREQTEGGPLVFGAIDSPVALEANLAAHAVPSGITNMTAADYPGFLEARRTLMADKMRRYYESL